LEVAVKLKASVTSGAPDSLVEAFGSADFAGVFLQGVVEDVFGVVDPARRPAEYYVQFPDQTVQLSHEIFGVEVRLTGVTRGERAPKVFHDALKKLEELVIETVQEAIKDTGFRVEVFVVLMLDSDVPAPPWTNAEASEYTSVLESDAKWVTEDHVEDVEHD